MSWHFSQELEGESSVELYLAGLLSARWSLNHTPATSSSNAKETDSSHHSPYGMMSAPSTAPLGADSLTLSAVASPVKTSQPQAKESASQAPAQDFGNKCIESFAKYDPATHSWKTPQCSLLADSEPYSETWPKQGMMQHGSCSELPMSVLHTSAKESGYSHMIPTPTACNAPNKGSNTHGTKSLLDVARTGWNPGEKWPTPAANDGQRGPYAGRESAKGHAWNLIDAVKERAAKEEKWLTPMALDGMRSNMKLESLAKHWEHHPNSNLAEQVAVRELFPTPTCQDSKNNGSPSQQNRNSKPLNAAIGGALNPPWVEWLMGWPIGWTDSKPLATDKYHSWLQPHSSSLPTS